MTMTQAETFGLAIDTARAVCRGETDVDRNNVIVRIFRRADRELRQTNPELYADGADMDATVTRLECMTLARWMRETVEEAHRPAFLAVCESKGIDVLGYLAE